MLVLWALLVPPLLLALPMGMEKLERRVALGDLTHGLEQFLTTAHPEDVEVFVSQGFAPALEDYWARQRRPPRRSRSAG